MISEMEKLLMEEEQNYQEVYKGSRVKGIVEVVKPDSFYISLSYKTDGILPKSEAGLCDDIKVGDELDLEVIKIDKNTGEIVLSKKRIDDFKTWEEINISDIINVKVVEKNEKGLIARYKGNVRGFIPLSHIETKFIGDEALDKYLGQEFDVEIIDLVPKKKRLILSRKNLLQKEVEDNRKQILEQITEGKVFSGIVKDIKDYGIFVDIGGITGLVHVSELSWNRRENVEKMFELEQKVDVQVISYDSEKDRLSLSIKSLVPNPWEVFVNKTNPGDIISGEVKNIKDYGVFISIEEGIDGFVHISNISKDYIKNPSDVVKIGDKLEAKVLNIDPEAKKIELTLILTEEEPEAAEESNDAPVEEVTSDDGIDEIIETEE